MLKIIEKKIKKWYRIKVKDLEMLKIRKKNNFLDQNLQSSTI
jgi:hypothetical protein